MSQWVLGEFDTHAAHLGAVSQKMDTIISDIGNASGYSHMYGLAGMLFEGAVCAAEHGQKNLLNSLKESLDGSANRIRETRKLNEDAEQQHADYSQQIEDSINSIPRPR